MWRLVLTAYFGILTTLSPSVCCCALRAKTNLGTCCSHENIPNETKTEHQKSCCSSELKKSCCRTDSPTLPGHPVQSPDSPCKSDCQCGKDRQILGPTKILVEESQSVHFSDWLFNRSATEVNRSLAVSLSTERNLAPCDAIYDSARELLRAHSLMRC